MKRGMFCCSHLKQDRTAHNLAPQENPLGVGQSFRREEEEGRGFCAGWGELTPLDPDKECMHLKYIIAGIKLSDVNRLWKTSRSGTPLERYRTTGRGQWQPICNPEGCATVLGVVQGGTPPPSLTQTQHLFMGTSERLGMHKQTKQRRLTALLRSKGNSDKTP